MHVCMYSFIYLYTCTCTCACTCICKCVYVRRSYLLTSQTRVCFSDLHGFLAKLRWLLPQPKWLSNDTLGMQSTRVAIPRIPFCQALTTPNPSVTHQSMNVLCTRCTDLDSERVVSCSASRGASRPEKYAHSSSVVLGAKRTPKSTSAS